MNIWRVRLSSGADEYLVVAETVAEVCDVLRRNFRENMIVDNEIEAIIRRIRSIRSIGRVLA